MNAADGNQLDEWPGTAQDGTAARTPEREILTIGQTPKGSRQASIGQPLSRASSPIRCCGGGVRSCEHLVLTIAVIVIVGLLSAGRASTSSPVPGWADVQRLRQLTRAENQALVVGDTSQLESLLAADFIAVMADGENMSGEQLIAALGSGDLHVWSIRIVESSPADPIEVHLNGNIATVSYDSDMEVGSHPISFRHDSTGADYHRHVRTGHTDTWTRSGDTWRHLRSQTTAIATTASG